MVGEVKNVEGGGTHILYRLDKQLFRRSTKGACMECFRECQFADDVALLAITHEAAETVTRLYQSAVQDFELTLSAVKPSKHLLHNAQTMTH